MSRKRQIAAHVARGGWKISKSYVEGVLKSEPICDGQAEPITKDGMPLKGEFAGHVYIVDSHEIKMFLGVQTLFVTGVMDAHTHAHLGLCASDTAANAARSADLLRHVVATWGMPRYVAIDGGPEFRNVFRSADKKAEAEVRLRATANKLYLGHVLCGRAELEHREGRARLHRSSPCMPTSTASACIPRSVWRHLVTSPREFMQRHIEWQLC